MAIDHERASAELLGVATHSPTDLAHGSDEPFSSTDDERLGSVMVLDSEFQALASDVELSQIQRSTGIAMGVMSNLAQVYNVNLESWPNISEIQETYELADQLRVARDDPDHVAEITLEILDEHIANQEDVYRQMLTYVRRLEKKYRFYSKEFITAEIMLELWILIETGGDLPQILEEIKNRAYSKVPKNRKPIRGFMGGIYGKHPAA